MILAIVITIIIIQTKYNNNILFLHKLIKRFLLFKDFFLLFLFLILTLLLKTLFYQYFSKSIN